MSCSCAQLPCQCSPVIDPSVGCTDPGSVDSGQFGATFEDNCVKRLQTWRGAEDDGTPIDDVLVSPKKAFRVQGEDGADRWKNPPCIEFPTLRLTTDVNGYGTNGADSIQARGGQCEVDLKGPLDEDTFMKWDHVSGLWKASPGITIVPPCVAILFDLMLTTGVTVYNIALSGPTGSWLLGGVFSIRGHQFKVTAIAYADGADDYVEGVTTIVTVTLTSTLSVSPMAIPHGECVNWKGLPELNLCGLTTVAPVDGKTLFDSIIVCKDGDLYALDSTSNKTITGTVDGKWKVGDAHNPLWWGIKTSESHGTLSGGLVTLPVITVTLPALSGIYSRYMVRVDYSYDKFDGSTAIHVITVNGQICRTGGASSGGGPPLLPDTEWVGAGIINTLESVSNSTWLTGIVDPGDYVFTVTRQGSAGGNEDWAIISISWFPIP